MIRLKWESETTSYANLSFDDLAIVDICPDTLNRFSRVTHLTNIKWNLHRSVELILLLSSHGNDILINLPQNASHSQIQYTLVQDALAHISQPQSCTLAHLV